MAISQVLLWGLVLCLALAVLALARQVGVLHERIAPLGALAIGDGPAVGDASPRVAARRLDGGTLHVGDALEAGRARLLLFVAADCPVCKKVIPLAKSVAKAERVELVFAGDGEPGALRDLAERFDLGAFPFVNGPELGTSFAVGKLPYGVLLDDAGRVAAKGLVNTREHLESLIAAKAASVGSMQDYLASRGRVSETEGAAP